MEHIQSIVAILSHIVALVIFVLWPVADPYLNARLKRSTNPYRRIWNYALIMSATALFSIVGVLYSPHDWWSSPIRPHWLFTVLALVLTVALTYSLAVPAYKVLRRPERRSKTHAQFEKLAFMLPQSVSERRWFVGVCLMAGFGEELVFRGFLVRYFIAGPFHFPALLAGLAATIGFGLNHGYQGWRGIISTSILGMVFLFMAAGFGSLIPGMILHALIDYRVLLLTLPEGHVLRQPEQIAPAPIIANG